MSVIKMKTSILIIIFYTFVDGDGRYLNGSIKPLNPVLTSGLNSSGVNISCSLPTFVNIDGVNVTSKFLYFSAGELTTSSARVVDDLTINLTLKDVSRFHSHVNVFCYANVSGVQHTVAQTRIIIVEPLVPPVFNGCVVHNWMEMFCDWKPAEPDFGIKTDVAFYYSINCNAKGFSKCPKQLPGRCWFEPGYYHGSPYCVTICFNNTNEQACSEVTLVDTQLLVKPATVKGSSDAGSRDAIVTLEKLEQKVVYHVEVEGAGKKQSIRSEITEVIHLERLRPHTEYKVRVQCMPLVLWEGKTIERGFLSDPYTFTFRTKPDVPEENPQLIPGSYNFDPSISPDGKSYVHIFWKKVPYECENGRMNATGVTYYEYPPKKDGGASGETRTEKSNPKETIVQLKWQLDRSKDYMVEVKSYNEVGSNDLIQPSRLIIPSISRAPKSPEHMYAILVNNSIRLKWSEVEDADNYTVYWCHLHHSTRKCQTNRDIEWNSHIPPGTTDMIVPSSDNLNLRVGISVERFDFGLDTVVSSGLNWARCIHKDNADVLPPQDLQFSPLQHPHSLTIMWSHPECSAGSYVSSYEVFWCKVNADVCSRSPNRTECCRGNFSSHVISKTMTSWIVERLDPGSEYEVKMRSLFFDRPSQFSDVKNRTVTPNGLSKVIIGLIVTASVLAIIFCPIVIIMTVKKIRRRYDQWNTRFNIDVPQVGDLNYPKVEYTPCYEEGDQNKDTTVDDQLHSNGDVRKVPLVSNGGPSSHSGISAYTSVMQKTPYGQVPDDRNALLRNAERPDDDAQPWQPAQALPMATFSASPCHPTDDDGDGGDDDVDRVDQNGQLGNDKKAKENVYV